MLFIGITGGVGAGKSAILNYLEENYRCRVMFADHIAHDLMEPGTECYGQLQELFAGDDVFLENGQIDRPKMAAVLFSDDEKREALNEIVHPAVRAYALAQAEAERQRGELDFLILEAALLIDEKYGAVTEELWYIYTSEENRRARLKANRGYSDAKIDGILASQMNEAEYRTHCVAEIDNNCAPEDAFRQVDALLAARGIQKRAQEVE